MVAVAAAAKLKVEALYEDIAASLQKIDGPTLRLVYPILAKAQAELETDLVGWLKKQGGSESWTAQRYRLALLQTRRAMDTIARLEPAMVAGLKVSTRRAGELSSGHLGREVKRLSEQFADQVHPLNIDVLAIQADVEKKVWRRFPGSAKRYAGEVGDKVTAELAIARARGETFTETARRLERRLPGVFGAARADAERLARTEGMNAYNANHEAKILAMAKEEPGWLMRWDSTQDRRVCPECASLDGAVIDPGDEDNKFTARFEVARADGTIRRERTHRRPPAHPRCRCVVGPWRKDWSTGIGELPNPAPGKKPVPLPPKPVVVKAPPPPPRLVKLDPAIIHASEAKKLGQKITGRNAAERKEGRERVMEYLKARYNVGAYGRFGGLEWLTPSQLPGAAGVMKWDGTMGMAVGEREVLGKFFDALAAGTEPGLYAQSAAKVLIHESFHHASPMLATSYRGVGAVIEEVTTEVAARGAMRDLGFPRFRMPTSAQDGNSYDWFIHPTLEALSDATGEVGEALGRRLERAAIEMRRPGQVMRSTAAEHMDEFVKALEIPADTEAAFRQAMEAISP